MISATILDLLRALSVANSASSLDLLRLDAAMEASTADLPSRGS